MTTIDLDETTIQHLEEIKKATGSDKNLLGLIQEAVYTQRTMFVTNTVRRASWQPIYTGAWVMTNKDDPNGITVEGSGEDSYWTDHLRPATHDDIAKASHGQEPRCDQETDTVTIPTLLYIEVQHRTEYPLSAVDYTEIVDPNDPLDNLFGDGPRQPRQFCQAAVVMTPMMKLF